MTDYDHVKDSGAREEFDTGSRRDTRVGKGRFDLISPIALQRLARHYENGAVKYGDRNWERGQPVSRYMDSALRHLNDYLDGRRDEDHLAAAAWNVFAMIHTAEKVDAGELPAELADIHPRPAAVPVPEGAYGLAQLEALSECMTRLDKLSEIGLRANAALTQLMQRQVAVEERVRRIEDHDVETALDAQDAVRAYREDIPWAEDVGALNE